MSHEKDRKGRPGTGACHEAPAAGPRERTVAHMRQILARSGVAGAALGIVTCECGTVVCDPLPSPTPPGAACTRTVISAEQGPLGAESLASSPFRTDAPGRLEVIVDWTFPSSLIGVYVVSGPCSFEQWADRSCQFLVRSEPSAAKPRRAASDATVAPGSYTLLLANYSSEPESLAFQVVLAQGNCAPLAAIPAGAEPPAASGTVRRLVTFEPLSGGGRDE